MALKAQYTAYHDTMKSANGTYPNESTCAAPPEIPFGTKIKVSGTGTFADGKIYTVTDRGGAVKKTGNRYIFDLWLPSEKECIKFGRRNGTATIVRENSSVKTNKNSKKTNSCDIVGIAAKETGYRETGDNQTKYGAWYGMNGAPWCHMFVSWCAAQAGVPSSVVPKTASTTEGMEWFKSRGLFKYKGKYIPKRGDLVYFKTGRSHVGLVEKVTGSTLHTIEGNSSDKVARRTYSLSDATITGYGVPKYTGVNATGGSTASGSPDSKNKASGKELEYLKKILNNKNPIPVDVKGNILETGKITSPEIVLMVKNGKKFFEVPAEEGMKIVLERKGSPGKLTFKAKYNKKYNITEGNSVTVSIGSTNFFYGFIFTRQISKDGMVSYTAYDQLRYLKNKDTIIYKEKTAGQLIKDIAGKFNLSCGTIADTVYKVSAVEDNTTLFDIIQNALDETLMMRGNVYVLYDKAGKLNLSDVSGLKVDACLVDEETGEDFTYKTSIDSDVYNQIKLIYENKKDKKKKNKEKNSTEKTVYEIYMARNKENINKWGVLQFLDKIDSPGIGKLKTEALLKLYNQKKRTLSVSNVIGNKNVRAGSLVPVILDLKDVKIKNYMMVEKVTHTFDNRRYTMDLVLSGGGFNG